MLSPDPVTQAPETGQNYNRYSYVFNNPLKYSDPSGYICYQLNSHTVVNDPLVSRATSPKPCPGSMGGFYVDTNGDGNHDEYFAPGTYPYWDSPPSPGLVLPIPEAGDDPELVTGPSGLSPEVLLFISRNLPKDSRDSCGVTNCTQYYLYGAQATIMTAKIFPEETNAQDNEADAFRHTFWSFQLSNSLGPEEATMLLNNHEYQNLLDKGPLNSTIIDLHNNSVGVYWGAVAPDDLDVSQISDLILWLLDGGHLITSP